MPLFSIIVPTRNRSGTVGRALESIRRQTFDDYEVIVVDDGDDGTEAIVGTFDDRVRYVRGDGRGVAAGRNLGIAMSCGDYVAFLDADDWWYPAKLARTVEAIRDAPQVGLFYSRLDFVDRNGRLLWSPTVLDVGERGYPIIVEGNFVANSTAVVNRQHLVELGGFDVSLGGCEDWDLWIRVARRAAVHLIDESLVAYEYRSEGSFTAQYVQWLESTDEVIEKSLREDPLLLPRANRIHAAASYVKGKICLGASDEVRALEQFEMAVQFRPAYWRARIYVAVLRYPRIRRWLPTRAKLGLRLPEAYE